MFFSPTAPSVPASPGGGASGGSGSAVHLGARLLAHVISCHLHHTLEDGRFYPHFTDGEAETQWVNWVALGPMIVPIPGKILLPLNLLGFLQELGAEEGLGVFSR